MHLLFLLLFPSFLFAQFLNSDLTITNYHLEKDVHSLRYGTQGIVLSFDYYYKHKTMRLVPVVPQLVLSKNGMEVFLDETTLLPLETNKNGKASIFIPYRRINLLNGEQEEVSLKLKIVDLLDYETTFSYTQPTRYIVEINLKGGSVKQQLTPYDQSSNPKEWLPDPYYFFTTNAGTEPVYSSRVNSNTYDLTPEHLTFHILEGELLEWSFYDRDGSVDERLGTFNKIQASGDFKDEFFGQMFGNIKNLEFTYEQRAQARQSISIYSDPHYIYQKKEGVAVTIEYDLAQAYVGKAATIHLNCYNKNGVMLQMPTLYAVEGTPDVGSAVSLEVKGKLKYFIPFYVWKNECQDLEFYFELSDKHQINAARHTLLRPIEFDDLVLDAGMEIEENFRYQGAYGVKIGLYYELVNMYDNAPLEVTFLDKEGKDLPFSVYNVISQEYAVDIKGKHVTKNPRVADRMYYFIPYANLNETVLSVKIDLIPDLTINILKEKTPKLRRKEGLKDVLVELVDASSAFMSNNYGQVLEIKLKTPVFFVNKCHVKLDVQKNKSDFEGYLLAGYFDAKAPSYIIYSDTGRLFLVFPHRNMTAGTTYEATIFVGSNENEATIKSDTVYWTFTAPNELFNRKIEVALEACVFDKVIAQDTSLTNDFPWEYMVEVGGERVVREVLQQRLNGKMLKERFSQEVLVNREDNIVVKLLHKKSNQVVVLWKGDLGKWAQDDLKTKIDNSYPLKVARVVAKIDKQYRRKKSEGGGIL